MSNASLRQVRVTSFMLITVLQITLLPGAPAQGLVYFNNRVTGVVDARVIFPGGGPSAGQGVGAGYTAQLFGGPEGASIGSLTPLFPTTTFRTSSAAAQGYVNPVVVELPGLAAGSKASLVMRIYPTGSSFTCAGCLDMGESNLIMIRLGGDVLPPANLEGLQPFVCCFPEPSTFMFGVLAVLVTFLWRWANFAASGCPPRRAS